MKEAEITVNREVEMHYRYLILAVIMTVMVSCAATSQKRSFGEVIDDSVLTTKVKTKLLSMKEIKALKINVDTWKGQVTLKGKVASQAEEDLMVEAVKKVKGVKSVHAQLSVDGSTHSRDTWASSETSKDEPKAAKPGRGSRTESGVVERDLSRAKAPSAEVADADTANAGSGVRPVSASQSAAHDATAEDIKKDIGFWTRPSAPASTTASPEPTGASSVPNAAPSDAPPTAAPSPEPSEPGSSGSSPSKKEVEEGY